MTSSAKIPKRKASSKDDPEQSRLFIEKAREIGANNERSESDELIGQLAKKAPEPRKQSKR